MVKNPYKSMVYKVDWFAFTVSDDIDTNNDENDFLLLKNLGYVFADFEAIPGRYFYNSGLTLGGYVNVYYNNYDKDLARNTSHSRNYVFTGQGGTDLAQKIENDWVGLFSILKKLGVKITRLDIALDDFYGVVSFNKMENKLNKGHYRSSKKTYNVVKQADVNGDIKGYTLYIGSQTKSSVGTYFLRCYDKYAQYKTKVQIPPQEAIDSGIWQRYEISFTKKKARKIVDLMVDGGQTIGSVFMDTMRDIVEFLEPTKTQEKAIHQNKNRWKISKWWQDFLDGSEKVQLGEAERDLDLGGLLRWLRVSVVPSLKLLEELGNEKKFDIHQIIKDITQTDYSKKQKRLFNNAMKQSSREILTYLEQFKEGKY
ncbi:replication initiation factor domain-containing protein [Lactococcus lactis]|uniref:replication initiation factor domain-containing protein n=1 Tax=Lactococcus lactis TaxID=1358 RepID=UPI002890C8BA|nr:replication initiation factor domain-containing protein [Lactococcus lactis]MDT2914829.1 replication initiation factor domain-containing protein [Lactococcus lactis]